jgi:serine/threonine protein kinase
MGSRPMAPVTNGTDPASVDTPIPLDGDGEELIGTTIDNRYRLDATLGRGGMGLVYRASHVGLRRQVAVKILHPSLAASPDVRSRFEREALAVGKIDHPNCVKVYDVGRLDDGALYLAMELLEGRSLSEVLEQEGQLAPGRALHILTHILRGLAHIHASGLIHRDMKPENIFLVRVDDDFDFAKILDFGIAKPMKGELSDDGVKLTQAGMAFGTPIYMAPEQALGNPLDGRADLYAAAVMGYEMLCGQPPFYSDDKLEVMSMHTARPVPPMRQRLIKNARPVPSSIEKLIVRGLTKKPNDRYASAEVFLAKVEEALETPDGGQTDVNFERPVSSTGAQSLLSSSGRISFDDELDVGPSPDGQDVTSIINPVNPISIAIDDVLSTPSPTLTPRLATPARGVAPRPATRPPPPLRAPTQSSPRLPNPIPPLAPVLPDPARVPPPRPGGVGIGLPYTGPQGEPIFGLTPEQRLPAKPVIAPGGTRAASKKRWPLYAGILGVAVVLGVVIAVATSPGGSGDLDPATLLAHSAEIGSDANGQLVLGRAYAATNDREPALAAYGRALELDPTLEKDPDLRASLAGMTTPDPKIVDLGPIAAAFELWIGKTKDPAAKKQLAANVMSDSMPRRHAVIGVVDKLNVRDSIGIDWITVYSHDLEDESQCETRKEVVGQLRALRDKRAVPALERALQYRGETAAWKGKLINACLADDARAAIAYLRGLK